MPKRELEILRNVVLAGGATLLTFIALDNSPYGERFHRVQPTSLSEFPKPIIEPASSPVDPARARATRRGYVDGYLQYFPSMPNFPSTTRSPVPSSKE